MGGQGGARGAHPVPPGSCDHMELARSKHRGPRTAVREVRGPCRWLSRDDFILVTGDQVRIVPVAQAVVGMSRERKPAGEYSPAGGHRLERFPSPAELASWRRWLRGSAC